METEDNVCVVCSDEMSIIAIGICDHPICYKCSTRLRVLCEEEHYCPTCRTDLPQVVLVRKLQKYEDIKNKHLMPSNSKYKMIFEDKYVEDQFNRLIAHCCPICSVGGKEGFPKFNLLRAHIRIEHKLFYCELCTKNLKIFSSERKLYNQYELGRHRNEGDPDDTSYRGHPMCKFCQQRYMDTDELYRHLRKDHLFCHFCDADGNADQYYDKYDVLKEHFREKHFLCEEPECAQAQFTHAFRTDIDLKKHIAQQHSQSLTRAQARQARTIELEFQLPPRVRGRDVSGGHTPYRNESNRGRMSKNQRGRLYFEERDAELKRAIEASLEEENQRQRQNLESDSARGGREEKKKAKKEEKVPTSPKLNLTEDFPSLTPGTSETNTFQTQWTSRCSTNLQISNRNEEFPSLTSLNVQLPVPQNNISAVTKKQATRKSEVNSFKQSQPSFENDFPELGAPSKKRPTSGSVSIVVSNAWLNNKQTNPQQTTSKNQSQKKQQQQPKQQQQQQQQHKQQQQAQNNNQHLITNSKILSKLSVGYNQPLETTPVLPAPNITTVTVIDNKPAETSKMTLKQVSRILDNEENFPSLTQKKKSNQSPTSSVKVAHWPVKKVSQKTQEENKKPSDGCAVLKGKKQKERANYSSEREASKQNKKEAPCLDSNKTSSLSTTTTTTTQCQIANEPVLSSSLKENEKVSGKKKEVAELKVELKKQPKNSAIVDKNQKHFSTRIVLTEDEFPSLGKQEKPFFPPGIKVNQINPPPGFSGFLTNPNIKNHRPPPGLTLPNNHMKNILNVPSNPVQDAQAKFHYCPPSNFEKRNKTLITEIRDALFNDESRFGTFKSLSKDFRQGVISSREYYRQCSDLLGPDKFPEILIELVCLLPDIDKQQALLLAYRDTSALQINVPPKNARRLFEKSLQSCPICQQVLIQADYNAHLSLCHPNYDFSLDSADSWSNAKLQESAWIKAK